MATTQIEGLNKDSFRVQGTPYDHQVFGVRRIISVPYLLVGDEPGLGKTAQVLWALDYQMNHRTGQRVIDKVLVFCKSMHAETWLRELMPNHLPGAPTFSACNKSPEERSGVWPLDRQWYFVSYGLASRMLAKQSGADAVWIPGTKIWVKGPDARNILRLLESGRCAMVLDEAQAIKNKDANVTKVLHAFGVKAPMRYCMTGTPVAEHPEDVWSIVYLLDRGATLGKDFRTFMNKYAIVREFGRVGYRDLNHLHKRLQSIMMRRTADQVLGLPGKVFRPYPLLAAGKQYSLLRDLRDSMLAALIEFRNRNKGRQLSISLVGDNAPSSFASLFYKYQRAATAPWLVDRSVEVSAKLDMLVELLNDHYRKEQLMVWTTNRDTTEAIADYLNDKLGDGACQFVHGSSGTQNSRRAVVDGFKAGEFLVLTATSQYLKENVTLINCAHQFYANLGFSLYEWLQSQDRLHRIGQQRVVNVHIPLLTGSMDAFIYNTIQRKEDHARQTVDNKTRTSQVDIERLIQYLKGATATKRASAN